MSVFEEEDEEFNTEDSQWEVCKGNNNPISSVPAPYVWLILQTLHDLMDESELESLSPGVKSEVSSADHRRRNLEENMRKEAEERKKKKKELMMREQEYEKVSIMTKPA